MRELREFRQSRLARSGRALLPAIPAYGQGRSLDQKDRQARRKHAYSVSGNGHKISPADTFDRVHRLWAAAAVGVRSRETNRRARTRSFKRGPLPDRIDDAPGRPPARAPRVVL